MLRNCSADTLYGKADDRLSRITSALLHLAQEKQESWEDCVLWSAPTECWKQIEDTHDRKKSLVLFYVGMDETEWLAAVRERTSERWVYYNLPF